MSQSRPNLIRSPPASAAGAAFILLPLTRRSSKAPTAQPWRPSRAPLVPLGRPPRGPSPVRSEPTGAAWSAAGLLDQESLAAVDLFYAALPNLKHDKVPDCAPSLALHVSVAGGAFPGEQHLQGLHPPPRHNAFNDALKYLAS